MTRTLIGCTKQNRAAFETTIGRTVDLVQIYALTDTPPTGEWATVTSLANSGYKVSVTYNSAFSLAQIISGSEDSRTTAIAAFLNALPTAGYVGFMHESENGGFVAADFRAAASRIYGILNANLSSGWKTMYTYTGGFRDNPATTNNQFTNGPPSNWWPTPNQPDLIGVDYYNWRGASNTAGDRYADPSVPDRNVGDLVQTLTGGVDRGIDSYMEFANSLTPVPKLCFPEFGCSVEDNVGGPALRASWIQGFANAYGGDPRVEFVNYFDLDQLSTPARVNWRISGGQEPAESASGAAFADIGGTITTLAAGTTTYVTHTTVAAGDTLRFPPNSSATLVMDHSSLVINGLLEMKPANASIVHELRFLTNDADFGVGGGIVVVPTDVGLWVMGDGVLDLQGTRKVGWNNTGTDPTWAPTDETFRNPNNPPDAGTTWYANVIPHVQGSAVPTVTAPNGRVFPTEVMNLTRNVMINGTISTAGTPVAHHRTHVFIRSTQPQSIKYVAFRYTAPMKYNPAAPTDPDNMLVIKGRWSLHFHDNMDGSRGSIVEGCVVRSFGGHGFVPHMSHGVTMRDCVAIGGNASGFWWNLDDTLSSDTLWDHNLATVIIPKKELQINAAPGFSLAEGGGSGIVDGRGSNIVRNCVAACVRGGQNQSGFMWTTVADPAVGSHAASEVWTTENNIAHNNQNEGVFIWYNVTSKHLIEDMVCYHNGRDAVLHGAYANTFMFDRLLCFTNNRHFEIHSVSHYPDQTHGMPGSFIRDSWIEGVITSKHEVPSGLFTGVKPRYTVLHSRLDQQVFIHDHEGLPDPPAPGGNPPGNQFEIYIDFVRCLDVNGNDLEYLPTTNPAAYPTTYGYFILYWMHPLSQWRVQRRDNTAYQLTEEVPSGALVKTDIPPFFYYVSNLSLTTGGVGSPFLQQMVSQLQRNPGTETWGLRTGSGPLPPGIAVSSAGLISGTPTTAGTYPVSIQVTDPKGVQAYREYDFTVAASANLQITTSSLPSGVVGDPYSQPLTATGGVAPRTFSLASGTLPPGLSVNSAGLISGTPTAQGNYSPTFRVTDSVAATAQRLLTIAVADLAPVWVTTSLPAAELTHAYVNTLVITQGSPPYTITIDTGTMPPGISMTSAGVFSGTPTVVGAYALRLRATDSLGHSSVRDFVINVYAALVFDVQSLPIAHVGEPYSTDMVATGGIPPVIFAVADLAGPGTDILPPGLTLDPDGTLSGIPTEAGSWPFGVKVTDGLPGQIVQGVTLLAEVPEVVPEIDRNQPKAFALRRPYGGSYSRDKTNR